MKSKNWLISSAFLFALLSAFAFKTPNANKVLAVNYFYKTVAGGTCNSVNCTETMQDKACIETGTPIYYKSTQPSQPNCNTAVANLYKSN